MSQKANSEHPFVCLFSVGIPSLEKRLFIFFARFNQGMPLSHRNALCILRTSPLSDI